MISVHQGNFSGGATKTGASSLVFQVVIGEVDGVGYAGLPIPTNAPGLHFISRQTTEIGTHLVVAVLTTDCKVAERVPQTDRADRAGVAAPGIGRAVLVFNVTARNGEAVFGPRD